MSNTGEGLEYHPTEADPLVDGFRVMHTIQLDDIEPGVLLDNSSWALLYRPLIFPAPSKIQAETIYTKVLPFLNTRPLMSSVVGTGGANAGNPLTPRARGGDASGARLALEAARACVAATPGVSTRRADALVEMGTRHVMLEAALQDLGLVPGERLGAAPAACLESACRTLAAAAGPHADSWLMPRRRRRRRRTPSPPVALASQLPRRRRPSRLRSRCCGGGCRSFRQSRGGALRWRRLLKSFQRRRRRRRRRLG